VAALKNKEWVSKLFLGFLIPVAVIALWALKGRAGGLISSPLEVYSTIRESLSSGFLLSNLWISFNRVMQGFFFGAAVGLLIGILTGLSPLADRVISPFFHGLRNVPIVGWVPLFIIWFGFGELSEIMLIAVGAFYPMILNTYQGIRGVSMQMIEVGRIFHYSRLRLFTHIVLPSALPSIATGVRISLANAWMFVVVAEIFGITAGGVGNMMNDAREAFKMHIVIMGIVVIGIMGFLLNTVLSRFEKYFLSWRVKENEN
jgi:sulfonate transport system permease protein